MIYLLLTLLALLMSGFLSALETAMYAANYLRLAELAREGDAAAKSAAKMTKNISPALATILLGNNLANGLGAMFFSYYLLHANVSDREFFTSLIITPLFFMFGETLPKQFAFRHADRLLIRAQTAFKIMSTIFRPFTGVLNYLNDAVNELLAKRAVMAAHYEDRMVIAENLENSYREGQISAEQIAMTNRIMEIEGLIVGAVTEPLATALRIDENMAAFAAGRLMIARKVSRALLIDDNLKITGFTVSVNNLMNAENSSVPVKNLARSAVHFDSRTPIVVALDKMRKLGASLALVEKRSQGVFGVVTRNQLIGCIVSGVENRDWEI